MTRSELLKNYLYWCLGQRDAFGDYKHFSRTLKYEDVDLSGEKITLELTEFNDHDFKLYVILNDFSTLYATKQKELALKTFNEFRENFKYNQKEAQ